jgi:hypothetical protein
VPNVSHLTRVKPRNADVDLGDGDSVHIVFDSNKITPAWVQESKEREEARDALSLSKSLASVLISWDVTQDDGSPFPPTKENIAVLSYAAQSALTTKILEASLPSDAEGEVSSERSGSPLTDSSEPAPTHQNGAATSPSPEHSASPSKT